MIENIGGAISKDGNVRLDFRAIASLIAKKNAKILDIGCGDGELLHFLKSTKKAKVRGLEINQARASAAISKGISVIQGDAEIDLTHYLDDSFDYAILSQTLQAMKNPKDIIEQMLRVAKYAIISLPNFAYLRNRFYLGVLGKMPMSKTIPFSWYDTPNIHFCSIKDFRKLCFDLDLAIKKEIFLTNNGQLISFSGKIMPNLLAEYGVFLVAQNDDEVALNTEIVGCSAMSPA